MGLPIKWACPFNGLAHSMAKFLPTARVARPLMANTQFIFIKRTFLCFFHFVFVFFFAEKGLSIEISASEGLAADQNWAGVGSGMLPPTHGRQGRISWLRKGSLVNESNPPISPEHRAC